MCAGKDKALMSHIVGQGEKIFSLCKNIKKICRFGKNAYFCSTNF